MITFNYETEFTITKKIDAIKKWIKNAILQEKYSLGELNYIFCDDTYLLKINREYLNHDTLTDIISFDYTIGKQINGDIYISIDRIKENAKLYKTTFYNEFLRVMIHGVLHYCGYKDKTDADKKIMRSKEDYYLSLQNI